MKYLSLTTLARIEAAKPCQKGWARILEYTEKTQADDDPLPLLAVLNSNGFKDAAWVLTHAMPTDRMGRHWQAWCAARALPVYEAAFPADWRVRRQIEMLTNDDAPDSARMVARAAAWAAAREAGSNLAARAAARSAAWEDVRTAAWSAARAINRNSPIEAFYLEQEAQEDRLRMMMLE